LYLAVVLDLFNREIVGWSIKARMTADIVVEALTMAWFRRKPARVLSTIRTGAASTRTSRSRPGSPSTAWSAR
jgi:transposase InsO family protein